MRSAILCFILSVLMSSCDFKHDTKTIISEAGETIGKGTSTFANSLKTGSKTLGCTVTMSSALAAQGLQLGKFSVSTDSSGRENTLSAYVIFNSDFNNRITVKVYDADGKEYGRVIAPMAGSAGTAKYIDFVFDKRVDIESKSKFALE